VNGQSVRVSAIDGIATNIPALRWTVDNGVGTAKFDRNALIAFFDSHGIKNRSTLITVRGAGSAAGMAFTFEGSDTTFVR
jgi:hypothetical protein